MTFFLTQLQESALTWSYAGLGLIPETHYCDHIISELANQSVIVLCQWTLLCDVKTPSSSTQSAFY